MHRFFPFPLIALFLVLGCGSSSPIVISSFELTSNALTARSRILLSIEVEGSEDQVAEWFLSEKDTTPSSDDEGWLEEKPTEYTLTSSFGEVTVYTWVKNEDGAISDPASLTVTYVEPGTEITEGWNKKLGGAGAEAALDAAVDSNGNLYVVGGGTNLVGGATGVDWWIKKFSSDGTEDMENWNKKFDGGSSGPDTPYAVAIDSEDNVYVAGVGTDLVGGATGVDWWIKKFSSDGTEDTSAWNKAFSSSGSETDVTSAMVIDHEDNVYVAGGGTNLVNGTSALDWWIKKFSSDGTEDTSNWNKEINIGGGTDTEVVSSLAVDSDGNLYAAGLGNNLVSATSSADWVIKKFSSDGTEDTSNWNKVIGFDLLYDSANALAVNSSDELLVFGRGNDLLPGLTGSDWWIKKFTGNGVEDTSNWNLIFDGNGASDYQNDLIVDLYDEVIVSGAGENLVSGGSDDDWWIKRFNANGEEDTVYWDKRFDGNGGEDRVSATVVDANNYLYVIGGGDNIIDDTSGSDWWIKKFVDK